MIVIGIVSLPFVVMGAYSAYYHARYQTYAYKAHLYRHDRWMGTTTIIRPDAPVFTAEESLYDLTKEIDQ